MAKRSPLNISSTAILAFIFLISYSLTSVNGFGETVGRRTKIRDAKTNREIQELGRYSVEEYNRGRHHHQQKDNGGGGGADLKFSQVVEAEKQVVSGIKYYLKVKVATPGGVPKTFDAVVVVKPWAHSKELLNFAPSPPTK